jgi:hypothetical protein
VRLPINNREKQKKVSKSVGKRLRVRAQCLLANPMGRCTSQTVPLYPIRFLFWFERNSSLSNLKQTYLRQSKLLRQRSIAQIQLNKIGKRELQITTLKKSIPVFPTAV